MLSKLDLKQRILSALAAGVIIIEPFDMLEK